MRNMRAGGANRIFKYIPTDENIRRRHLARVTRVRVIKPPGRTYDIYTESVLNGEPDSFRETNGDGRRNDRDFYVETLESFRSRSSAPVTRTPNGVFRTRTFEEYELYLGSTRSTT